MIQPLDLAFSTDVMTIPYSIVLSFISCELIRGRFNVKVHRCITFHFTILEAVCMLTRIEGKKQIYELLLFLSERFVADRYYVYIVFD